MHLPGFEYFGKHVVVSFLHCMMQNSTVESGYHFSLTIKNCVNRTEAIFDWVSLQNFVWVSFLELWSLEQGVFNLHQPELLRGCSSSSHAVRKAPGLHCRLGGRIVTIFRLLANSAAKKLSHYLICIHYATNSARYLPSFLPFQSYSENWVVFSAGFPLFLSFLYTILRASL